MKKLLLSGAVALLSLSGFNVSAEAIYSSLDRTGWTITGCSQRGGNGDTDGGFTEMIDGNTGTYWHTQYGSGAENTENLKHFFIIDRGENAPDFNAFGYTPRIGATTGNGYVTASRLYVADDVTGINTCEASARPGAGTDTHSSLETWIESNGNKLVATSTYAITYNTASTHHEYKVDLEATASGRYVIFVVDGVSSSQTNKHAHCAEFNLYDYREVTDEDITNAKSDLSTKLAALAEPEYKANVPGYYTASTDEGLTEYNEWLAACQALAESETATYAELTAAIAEVEAAATTPRYSSNTDLAVADGTYKIINSNGRGYIYDAEREDGHVMTSKQNPTDYPAQSENSFYMDPSTVSEAHAHWTVVKASDNQYYIYNVATKKFLVAPASQAANQYWTLSETAASPISLTASPEGYGKVEILGNGNIHMGMTSGYNDRTWVVSYYAQGDGGIPFGFERIGDSDASLKAEMETKIETVVISSAKAALTSAIAAKEANLGTTLGTYALTDEQAAAISAAKEVYNNADATFAQVDEATASVNAIVRELNKPVAGRFYRFQNVSSGNYMTNSNNTASPVKIPVAADAQGNMHTDVFYYDGQHLVSYTNGLVIGKFLSGEQNNSTSWTLVDKDNAKAADAIEFKTSASAGKYNIVASNGRYLHGAGDVVNCGSSDADNGYRWTITQVDRLPVYFGDAAETTIYSPVGLTLSGRAKAHTLYVNSDAAAELVKTPAEAIAANTPYFLEEHTTGNGWDATTKCVYLQVNYSGAAAAAENPNALSGSIYATQKASDTSYFTLGTENEEAHFLAHSADETYVPGFTAHYAVATDNVVAEGKYKVVSEENKTTGISEVVAGGENGVEVIYDLQGRRVANASKGIFIINGVKTLVK